MYDLLLTLHLLAVVLWVGGGATLHVIGRRAIASGDGERILQFVRDASWIGPRLYAPLSILLIVAGTLLVNEAGYQHSDVWISLAYLAWLITFAIGVGYYGRASARVEAAAQSGGPSDPGVLAGARQIAKVNTIELTILLLAIVDMVVKPGL